MTHLNVANTTVKLHCVYVKITVKTRLDYCCYSLLLLLFVFAVLLCFGSNSLVNKILINILLE